MSFFNISRGVIASEIARAFNSIGWGLTADLAESTNTNFLTVTGVSSTPIAPSGFTGDGYSHRLEGGLPSWLSSSATKAVQATITLPVVKNNSKEVVWSIVPTADDGTHPFLQVVSKPAPNSGVWGNTCVEWYDGAVLQFAPLGRCGWGWENTIQHSVGYYSKPQGVLFLDSNTLLYSVHNDDTESIVYKYSLSSRSVIGQFTFGANYKHVGTFARTSSGDVWCTDYLTGTLVKVDLTASFSAGTAVVLATVDASALTPSLGCVAFATISSTEYLFLATYSTSDSTGYLYQFPMSALGGATILPAGRIKRWVLGARMQGIVVSSSNILYVARNAPYALSAYGALESFDLSGMVSTLADGSVVSQNTNPTYFLKAFSAPTAYPEDLDIHPTTGEIYTTTEGFTSVGDERHIASIWKTDLSTSGYVQTYTTTVSGNTLTVKVGNNVWFTKTSTFPQAPDILTVGGMYGKAAGLGNNFTWANVKNLFIQDSEITSTQYNNIIAGSLESSSLTSYTLTLTNPSGETGDTTGWTNEAGALAAKNVSNRRPPLGTWYFDGGSNANTRARQRLQLSTFGLTDAKIDSGKCYIRINWYQAQYNNFDPGSMGIRLLDGAQTTISTTYSGLVYTLGQDGPAGYYYWYPRTLLINIPANCRYVDAVYNAPTRNDGTNNDCYVDAVEMVVYEKP